MPTLFITVSEGRKVTVGVAWWLMVLALIQTAWQDIAKPFQAMEVDHWTDDRA